MQRDDSRVVPSVLAAFNLLADLLGPFYLRCSRQWSRRRQDERTLDPVTPGFPLTRRLELWHLSGRERVPPLHLVTWRLHQCDPQSLVVECRRFDGGVLRELAPHVDDLPPGKLWNHAPDELSAAESQPFVSEVDVQPVCLHVCGKQLLQRHHARGHFQHRLIEVNQDADLLSRLLVIIHACAEHLWQNACGHDLLRLLGLAGRYLLHYLVLSLHELCNLVVHLVRRPTEDLLSVGVQACVVPRSSPRSVLQLS
mmetsp:Transcript_87755/g.196143  ORF Transcript_87755/g.196143 Transcript_87755/m.196143 type:complete len:254 (+) Transcript_87755:480-1241(+)